jgi:hypothetical protein
MNVLETWCCLLFRSLPKATLEEWLGSDLEEGLPSLNVALPLDTGDEMASKTAFDLLKDADEVLAKEYYWDMKKGRLRPKPVNTNNLKLAAGLDRTVQAAEGRQPSAFASIAVGGMLGFCIAAVFFYKSRARSPAFSSR